jgi:chemotaxis protein methyltransferase CheR
MNMMASFAGQSRTVERLSELLSRRTGQLLSESRRWRIETLLRPLLREQGLPRSMRCSSPSSATRTGR